MRSRFKLVTSDSGVAHPALHAGTRGDRPCALPVENPRLTGATFSPSRPPDWPRPVCSARVLAFAAGATTGVTADEALEKLKAGNAKYLSAPQICEADLSEQREQVAKTQTPWAPIVTCSDSRVPPELLFGGTGLGELFVARNAGNMADTATMGTLEYGAENLGVPLIVVMGHERCGAVAAACSVVEKHAIVPGLDRSDGRGHRSGREGGVSQARRFHRQYGARERKAHGGENRHQKRDRFAPHQSRQSQSRGRALRPR